MLVDQSFGMCFIHEGQPATAWEVVHKPQVADLFGPSYLNKCRELELALGHDILARDFKMAISNNPLLGFECLGYCNHSSIR